MKYDIATLRHVAAKGEGSEHILSLGAWLRDVLAAIPEGESRTTRELLIMLGTPSPVDGKLIGQALWRLRKAGIVDDCFTVDLTRRYMGNPLIMWTRPAPGAEF